MHDSSEMELVRRLVADDPSALEEAYRVYAPRCNAAAYRITRDSMRAEDAVQEAFLALWRRRGGLVVRTGGVGPWLLTVTRNAALSTLRAEQRRLERERRAGDTNASADVSEDLANRESASSVRAALGKLPDEQRSVISLAYFGYYTLPQIAQRTGAPLGTVKRRAQLGLRRLARELREQPA